MKIQFWDPFNIVFLWISFCVPPNWRENITGSNDAAARDLVIWAHLIYDTVVFQTVHLHVPFNFSYGLHAGCSDRTEL